MHNKFFYMFLKTNPVLAKNLTFFWKFIYTKVGGYGLQRLLAFNQGLLGRVQKEGYVSNSISYKRCPASIARLILMIFASTVAVCVFLCILNTEFKCRPRGAAYSKFFNNLYKFNFINWSFSGGCWPLTILWKPWQHKNSQQALNVCSISYQQT